MEEVENHMEREILRMEVESRSSNEEFARVAVAVFMSRLDPTMEEIDDVKTAVSEAVVYIGSMAFSTSLIPTPRSRISTDKSCPSIATCM